MESFWIPFFAIALAELGDKTQLAIMLLASENRRRLPLFWGTLLAFFIVDGSAIFAGSWIIKWVPLTAVKIISGILFIVFGILMLRSVPDTEATAGSKNNHPFWAGFGAIFFAEWGDKTQIASGLFAARYFWPGVLAGALSALALLSLLAIYAGGWISRHVPPQLLKRIAGTLFILLGLAGFFIPPPG
jgi:putative Ca2+/H+ antiporter (TMEM165/GDT1 family)